MKRRLLLQLLVSAAVGGAPLGCGSGAPLVEPPPSASCVTRRAAFDIGSGTTKVKVADVDRCNDKLGRILFAEDTPVFYGVDVADARGDGFREATMARGFAALAAFKARADTYQPEAYAAVATAAFRLAANAAPFIERIESELGIPVHLITQAQEARLGFLGAVRAAGVDPKRAVVWDVGGSSMQMTALGPDGHLMIDEGHLASGQMREHLVHRIQGKDGEVQSPNPVSGEDASQARAYAEAYAEQNVSPALRDKLAQPTTVVIGIGALKYYGDRSANEPGASCSPAILELRLGDLIDKSDREIGGDYAATQVSDRLLLVGFMRALGIDAVRLVDVDLTDGLLVDSEYWPANLAAVDELRAALSTRAIGGQEPVWRSSATPGRAAASPGPTGSSARRATNRRRSASDQRGSTSQAGSWGGASRRGSIDSSIASS